MKILVVHEVSYLRKVIYEIHEFPELLALKGHEVTFLEFDEGADRSTLPLPRDRNISGRIHKDAKIRLVTPHRFGLPQIDRIWAIFSSIPLLFSLFSKSKFDVVLNYAVPTYAMQLNLLARLFRVPVLHRALDVSSKIRESFWNPLIHLYEYFALLMPNRISANNPAMKTYLETRIPKWKRKSIEVHYPPLDTSIFKPRLKDRDLQSQLGIPSTSKVVMYMGSFFYFSGLDEVIASFANEARRDQTLRLLLIGGGEQEHLLRELVSTLKLKDKVIFTGFVDFRDLTRYMSLADVAINPLKNGLVAGAAFPHKVLQYMATGIPAVSTKLEGLYMAFGDSSGIIWTQDSKEVLERAISLLATDKKELLRQVQLQMRVIEQLFSTEATVNALEKSLMSLTGERKTKRD
ncbi:MAG: hypothetical protein RL228_839 [Actinomycetota bacterium]